MPYVQGVVFSALNTHKIRTQHLRAFLKICLHCLGIIVITCQHSPKVFEDLYPFQFLTTTEELQLECVLETCCCLMLHLHLVHPPALHQLLVPSVESRRSHLHVASRASWVGEGPLY
jgi:hypothetical protein